MSNRVKERNTNFIEMWKMFWNPDLEEVNQEETISQYADVPKKERDALIKALKVADSIVKPTGGISKSVKTLNLKVGKKEQIEHIKANPVKIQQELEEESKGQEIAE